MYPDTLGAAIRALPKVEIHLHLEGAIPLPALFQLVEKYGGNRGAEGVRTLDELEEKFRQFEAERAKHPLEENAESGNKGKSQPQARGKWLARLGLKDGKDG